MGAFSDGLKSFFNKLTNDRNAVNGNGFTSNPLKMQEASAIWATGIGSKIVRIKSGYALKNTIKFDSTEDKKFYEKRLAKAVKKASKFQLGFGRGIIVIHPKGDNLKTPLKADFDISRTKLDVFSGDMVTPNDVSTDLANVRYLKPRFLSGQGSQYSLFPRD